jgi:hypothetical protein
MGLTPPSVEGITTCHKHIVHVGVRKTQPSLMKEHRIADGGFALAGKDFIGDALDPPLFVGLHGFPKHAAVELSWLVHGATDRKDMQAMRRDS